jgi:hypothetical protein
MDDFVDDFDDGSSCGGSGSGSGSGSDRRVKATATGPTAPAATAPAATAAPETPVNFSRVDFRVMSAQEVRKRFPEFPERPTAVIDVRAGESLFLPAGYFHAVESFAAEQELPFVLGTLSPT